MAVATAAGAVDVVAVVVVEVCLSLLAFDTYANSTFADNNANNAPLGGARRW